MTEPGIRYTVKWGKFGAYFYDTKLDRDMTLKEVCAILNLYEVDTE